VYRADFKPPAKTILPQFAHDKVLSATLLRVVSGVQENWTWAKLKQKTVAAQLGDVHPSTTTNTRPVTWMAFQLQENDRVTTGWKVENLTATDTVGSMISSSLSWNQAHRDFNVFQFGPPLWCGAGAFTIQAEFTRDGNYLPDELWTFDADVPTTALFVELRKSQNMGGVPAVLEGIGGPKADSPHGGCTSEYMHIELGVPESSSDPRRLHLISAVDNLGQKLRQGCSSTSNDGGMKVHSFALEPERAVYYGSGRPAGEPLATSVTVTLALTRSHFLFFTAEPEPAR
jgi:hypothetical protein